MSILNVSSLRASVGETAILKGLNLTINPGEIHAIMGPNGSGKSTFANVLAGRPGYDIDSGTVEYLGNDISEMAPNERSTAGIFLAFQYPVEIPGVTMMNFLKTALECQARARGETVLTTPQFMQRVKTISQELSISTDMLRRPVNDGFSGGEKKRAEILQMALLAPNLCILDETDSGLDIDALRIVSDGVNSMRAADRGILIITHYQRLLDYIEPNIVHVMRDGKIVASGDKDLALQLEKDGYAGFTQTSESTSGVAT